MPHIVFDDEYLPNDKERIICVREMIKKGHAERVLISHDTGMKFNLIKWGGVGWAHILRYIYPRMLKMGISEEQFKIMMVENPKRLLAI